MAFKPFRAPYLLLMLVLAGCGSLRSETLPHREGYIWVPPSTGSNVGRWVPKKGAKAELTVTNEEKKGRAAKRAEAKKAKVKERPAQVSPAPISPPDRFR